MEEGSKKTKNTTTIKGTIKINGRRPGPNTLVFMETKKPRYSWLFLFYF